MVNDLAEAITLTDQKIAEAQSELTRFDNAFDNVEVEGTAADEHAWRAAVAFKEAEESKTEIQERLNEEMVRRHELQVPTLSSTFFACSI